MSTTEALKDGEQHWEFCESVIISSEIIFMFGLNEFHWTAKTCALIWTLFPSTSYNLTLLWPFWLAPFTLTWWCQVTGRYLVEERIFSVVLDLSLRGWGGGLHNLPLGLVWPLSLDQNAFSYSEQLFLLDVHIYCLLPLLIHPLWHWTSIINYFLFYIPNV